MKAFFGFVCSLAAGNVWLIHLWGKVNEPFMQLAHCLFGVGAFVGPIICQPFLFPLNELEKLQPVFEIEPSSNRSFEHMLAVFSSKAIIANLPLEPTAHPIVPVEKLRIKYAYAIVGLINLAIFMVFVLTYLKKRSNKPHPTRVAEQQSIEKGAQQSVAVDKEKQSIGVKPTRPMTTFQKVIMILLISLLAHLTYALELAFGQLLTTFAVKSDLHLEKSTGSFITSFYWACFTFFRLITIFLVNYMSSRTALYMDLALVMTGMAFLVPLANTCEWALWVGSAFIGIGTLITFFAFNFVYLI